MGWNDREPWFSMIEARTDEGMSYDDALQDAVDAMREHADAMRKGE
jgi:hypothetical protein